MPADLALEAGADAPFDIRLHHRGNASLTIEAVDLIQLDDPIGRTARPRRCGARPRHRPAGQASVASYRSARRKVVIIGNCQSETLRQGFARIESLNRLFDVKYHFIQLQKNLHEFAVRDLETCDILLIQDIRLWDEFPLRDSVRPGAEAVRFPLVRFASPWPFDAWNGPGDKEALRAGGAEPDLSLSRRPARPPARGNPRPGGAFHAYRSLDVPGVVNYRRLHEMEVRRLAGMDKKFGFAIGELHSGKFPEQADISHDRAAELGGVQPVDAVGREIARRQPPRSRSTKRSTPRCATRRSRSTRKSRAISGSDGPTRGPAI